MAERKAGLCSALREDDARIGPAFALSFKKGRRQRAAPRPFRGISTAAAAAPRPISLDDPRPRRRRDPSTKYSRRGRGVAATPVLGLVRRGPTIEHGLAGRGPPRRCRDAERAYGQESILKGASGREFGSEGLGFGERIPVAPTRSTERERADRLVDALLAPDLGRADPKFKPESVSRIGPDEARFWPSAVYDAYKPPRSDTMKPSSPIQRARSPVKQTEEDDEAAELFFDIDKALEDGAYRARLVGRRGIFDAPDDDGMVPDLSEHGVVRPPRARVVREMAFLAQARESPTTDV